VPTALVLLPAVYPAVNGRANLCRAYGASGWAVRGRAYGANGRNHPRPVGTTREAVRTAKVRSRREPWQAIGAVGTIFRVTAM